MKNNLTAKQQHTEAVKAKELAMKIGHIVAEEDLEYVTTATALTAVLAALDDVISESTAAPRGTFVKAIFVGLGMYFPNLVFSRAAGIA